MKQDMMKAQSLLKSGKYNEAIKILANIDHPTADKWRQRAESIVQAQERQKEADKKKNTGIGCLFLLVVMIICGVIFALMPTTASKDNITNAALKVDGVYAMARGVIYAETANDIWVDVCVSDSYVPEDVARHITESVRKMNGTTNKTIWVTVTNSSNTFLYYDMVLLNDEYEKEFCG